jgi:hypothetical protein
MGKSKELFEKIRNETEQNLDYEAYFYNNYIETVTIGSIYKE